MQVYRSRDFQAAQGTTAMRAIDHQPGPASTRRPWMRLLLIGLLLCGWMQACQCNSKPPCDKASDCPTAQNKCVAGYCHTPCTTDEGCESGQRCFAGICLDPNEEPALTEQPVDTTSPDTKAEQPGKETGTPEPSSEPVTPEEGVATPDAGPDASPDGGPDATTEPKSESTPDGGNEAIKEGTRPELTNPEDISPDATTGVCTPGEKRPCYNSLPGTEGIGLCKVGEELCSGVGAWGACTGEVLPQPEICDGKDNDCDGKIDEDYPQKGSACVVDAGECAGKGVYACKPDGAGLFCEVQGKQSAPEKCDGKDNDCDGLIDEDFPNLGKACFDGEGACKRQGAFVCSQDQTTTECTAKKGPAYTERCNGRDDDCDGLIDEDFTTKGDACKVGVGACETTGKLICNTTGTGVTCDAVAGTPAAELCNGKDDDCNGQIDDNLTQVPLCANQQGVCAGAVQSCVNGVYVPCTATEYTQASADYEATETRCDGKDNDCNGKVDDGYPTLGQTCSIGQCNAPDGKFVCDPNNNKFVICDIKLRKEICANNEDDNCDGTIDEGCPLCTPETYQSCYFGPPKTKDIGQCSGSTQGCESNGVWGDCAEWNGPSTEVCNNAEDEDCNGLSGEGCGDCPFARYSGSFNGHTDAVNAVTSRYSSRVITGSSDNTVKIWNFSSLTVRNTMTGHTGKVTSVAVSRYDGSLSVSGDAIASGSEDKSVRMWDTQGNFVREYTGHTDIVTGVAFDRYGTRLYSTSADKTIKVWDTNAVATLPGLLATITGHTAAVNGIAIDVQDLYLATASADNTVRLWDRKTNAQIGLPVVCAGASNVVFYPDGSMIAAACSTEYRVWKVSDIISAPTVAATALRTFTPPAVPRIGADSALSLDFTADGDSLIGGTGEGRVVQFNFATGAVIESHNRHTGAVRFVQRGQDNRGFLTASADKTAASWNCAAFLPTVPACQPNNGLKTIPNAHTDKIKAVIFSRFAKSVYSAGDDKLIKQYDTETGTLLRTFTGHAAGVTALSLSGDGKRLASCGLGGTVRIWDANTGTLLFTTTYTDATGGVISLNDLAISPDGGVIAAAASDNNVYLINARTGAKLTTLTGHTQRVNAVDFDQYGFYMISASNDGTVRLYNRSGTLSYSLSRVINVESQGPVIDAIFTLSRLIVTLSGPGGTNLRTYRTSGSLDRTMSPAQAQLPFQKLAASPDNSLIAATNEDGDTYFWQYSSGRPAGSQSGHSSTVTGFAWSFDGQITVSASDDKSIRLSDCQAQPASR